MVTRRIFGLTRLPFEEHIPLPYYKREHVHGLYDDFLSYLGISARVVSKVGNIINEGETFILRVTVTSGAPNFGKWDGPQIVFVNPWVYIRGTDYATPKTIGWKDTGWHELPDNELYPGESSYIDVEFTADQALPSDEAEHIATVNLWARLDINKYFTFHKPLEVYKNIEPS